MSTLSLPRQIETGSGSIQQLANYVLSCNAERPLIVMDAFLAKSPIRLHEKVQSILQRQQINCTFFTGFSGEPTISHVKSALEDLHSFQADCLIAIGGGSAIDISKAVALFGKSPNLEWEAVATERSLSRMPLIAIPTTSGTGSEATGIMVISDEDLGIKLNPGHPHLIPDIAILDPDLLLSLPKHFTAFTGMDALTHAIEAYVSTRAHALTDSYALHAIKLISKALPIVYEDGTNLAKRQEMLLASCYAGTAFFNSSTNLAHAIGRALGNRFHIPHGLSVAVLLPYVMGYGLKSIPERYRDIALALGADPNMNDIELAKESIAIVHRYNESFGIWESLAKYVDDADAIEDAIPAITLDALSGNGIKTNRQIPTDTDIKQILHSVFAKLTQSKVNTII